MVADREWRLGGDLEGDGPIVVPGQEPDATYEYRGLKGTGRSSQHDRR